MVEQQRRKLKTKRRDKNNRSDSAEPTKEEYAVAKYVRFNCPSKTATIMGNEMAYFTASKAIDCLMSSKWAGDSDKKLFSNRHACVFYMQTLLDKGLFFRAKKLVPKKKDSLPADSHQPTATITEKTGGAVDETIAKKVEKRRNKKEGQTTTTTGGNEDHGNSNQKQSSTTGSTSTEKTTKDQKQKTTTTGSDEAAKEKTSGGGGKKKTKKVKFDIHQNQVFNDGNDIYVWKYDPTSMKMFLLGLAMVIGSIGICLFPLWPHEVRVGVYYLSIAAMVFVGVIILLVVLRSILFGLVWLLTFGRHHFWLLPHLTDDCGFFDSFKPLYSHTTPSATSGHADKKTSATTADSAGEANKENVTDEADEDKKSKSGEEKTTRKDKKHEDNGEEYNNEDDDTNSGAEKESDEEDDGTKRKQQAGDHSQDDDENLSDEGSERNFSDDDNTNDDIELVEESGTDQDKRKR